MKKVRIDITGQKFGRLTVIKYVYTVKKTAFWLCQCDCGNFKIIRGKDLKSARIQSCGCLRKEMQTKHGLKDTNERLYRCWCGIKQRCFNKNHTNYKNYGERGIIICKEWLEFENFYNWAINNGYDEKAKKGECTLDRIDNNGNYEPNNCRFITMKEQARNKSTNNNITYNGETHCITEWSEIIGIKASLISLRLKRNWSIERALTQPIQEKKAR